jgi:hypothetical protein
MFPDLGKALSLPAWEGEGAGWRPRLCVLIQHFLWKGRRWICSDQRPVFFSLLPFWSCLEKRVPVCPAPPRKAFPPPLPPQRPCALQGSQETAFSDWSIAGATFQKSQDSGVPLRQFPKDRVIVPHPPRPPAASLHKQGRPAQLIQQLLALTPPPPGWAACPGLLAAVSHGASRRVGWPALCLGRGGRLKGAGCQVPSPRRVAPLSACHVVSSSLAPSCRRAAAGGCSWSQGGRAASWGLRYHQPQEIISS